MNIAKQKEAHRYRERTSGCRWRDGKRWANWRQEIKRYKLLYVN